MPKQTDKDPLDPQEKEARVQDGVELVRQGFTLKQAADVSGAPMETIRRRKAGQMPREDVARTGSQRLTDAQEAALVSFVIKMEDAGFPLRQSDVEEAAMDLIHEGASASGAPEPEPLGKCWFSRFCKRHKNMLAFRTKETLAKERTRGLTEERASHFYALVSGVDPN